MGRPPSDDNRLKHNVRDEVIDVACDFGLERVK